MRNDSISVIIPAYNEEAIIKDAVSVAYEVLQSAGSDFELIVVNDGSRDKTRQILDEYFSHTPKIIVHHKDRNEGFGSAVRTGVGVSTKQFILCVPVDNPLTAGLFAVFLENTNKADVLVSYRKKRLDYSLRMHVNSWIYHQLISFLFDMHLRDYNWIHMYNRKIFEEGEIKIEYDGIFMLAEVLIKAKRKQYSFYEMEVEQHERLTGIATASKIVTLISTLHDLVHFFADITYRKLFY